MNLVNSLSLILFSILAGILTGQPVLNASQVILLIGFDLVLSESFFNTIVSIEDFSSNENFSSFT